MRGLTLALVSGAIGGALAGLRRERLAIRYRCRDHLERSAIAHERRDDRRQSSGRSGEARSGTATPSVGRANRLRHRAQRPSRVRPVPVHPRHRGREHLLRSVCHRLAAVPPPAQTATRLRVWRVGRDDPTNGRPASGDIRGAPALPLRRRSPPGPGPLPRRHAVRGRLVCRRSERAPHPMTLRTEHPWSVSPQGESGATFDQASCSRSARTDWTSSAGRPTVRLARRQARADPSGRGVGEVDAARAVAERRVGAARLCLGDAGFFRQRSMRFWAYADRRGAAERGRVPRSAPAGKRPDAAGNRS